MSKPYVPNDRLAKRARFQNYRARSVYKLQELDQKYHLIQPGMKVLDIGAAPGSWLQYASKKLGDRGQILGVDLQEIEPVAQNVATAVCDITNLSEIKKNLQVLGWDKVDLILSDIAPSTTGISDLDHGRSIELNQHILTISKKFLKPGKKLVMKVFEGREFSDFIKKLKTNFTHVEVTKSHASRERSKEKYILCY